MTGVGGHVDSVAGFNDQTSLTGGGLICHFAPDLNEKFNFFHVTPRHVKQRKSMALIKDLRRA
eukprot:1285353-Pleurochrysis_carterae.AAC.1